MIRMCSKTRFHIMEGGLYVPEEYKKCHINPGCDISAAARAGSFQRLRQTMCREIEVRSGDGDHSVEAPGIIVIQEVSEGMEEPEDKEEREGTGHAMPDGSQEELGESCGMFEITGYCSCELCTGDNQLTFSGTVPRPGHTAAADLDIFPLGSRIRIGEAVYTVEDTGACITGHVIDIYFDTHEKSG